MGFSSLDMRELGACGSKFNMAGAINIIGIQIQLTTALPVSTQLVASEGATRYPVGHFWSGVSIHITSATDHKAAVAPPNNARIRCVYPFARK